MRGLPTYRTPPASLARAALAGIAVAIGVGVLWRFFPTWEFYLCLLLGFGTVETIARLTGNKRGVDLQAIAIAIVVFGLVLSRVLLAQRFGISFGEINSLDERLTQPAVLAGFGRPASVADALQLHLIPNGVYALMACLIAWVRFR